MIAAGHDVDAVREQIVRDVGRDAEPCRRVLDVGNDEVNVVVRDERGQAATDQLAARAADDVANKEETGHRRSTGT